MQRQRKLCPLEALPNELLREIFSRVASSSRTDVRNIMQSSPELAQHAKDNQVVKRLNLGAFASRPLWALNNFQALMERCLESILEYFQHNNPTLGLEHLKTSADSSYKNGIYLYGILMLCRGEMDEGKAYLDKLQWKENKKTADQCWRSIQTSLQGIPVIKKSRYRNTLRNNKPPPECHLNDMDNRCNKCYYYKQMRKFVSIRTL
ncbi:hypothetical protein EUTSA_v10002164mg [Eutrema salsugineum]|uniref:At2g35280-like TPR domain-containing protein n=1 Tax=Eutrema salsugineum TaxID=72664 RepID=V4NTT4_EUTSA|nr:hypothetical protein EUTSA_v10002164mg [Eutrema salsugineum]